MKYQTISQRVFGVDPGMANCGWSVVVRNRSGKFILIDSGCIRTSSAESEGARLLTIYQQVSELLHVHVPNNVAIERVFHNKNVSSSLTTASVIGVCQLASAQMGLDVAMFTPQQVKSAVGIPNSNKASVLKHVNLLLDAEITNHHEADAAAAAIAGFLMRNDYGIR